MFHIGTEMTSEISTEMTTQVLIEFTSQEVQTSLGTTQADIGILHVNGN